MLHCKTLIIARDLEYADLATRPWRWSNYLARAISLMFKFGGSSEKKWRRLRGFVHLAKVVTEIKSKEGIEVTEVDQAVV